MPYLRGIAVIQIVDIAAVCEGRLKVEISSFLLKESWEYGYLCEILWYLFAGQRKIVCLWTVTYRLQVCNLSMESMR